MDAYFYSLSFIVARSAVAANDRYLTRYAVEWMVGYQNEENQ